MAIYKPQMLPGDHQTMMEPLKLNALDVNITTCASPLVPLFEPKWLEVPGVQDDLSHNVGQETQGPEKYRNTLWCFEIAIDKSPFQDR